MDIFSHDNNCNHANISCNSDQGYKNLSDTYIEYILTKFTNERPKVDKVQLFVKGYNHLPMLNLSLLFWSLACHKSFKSLLSHVTRRGLPLFLSRKS